MFGISKYIQKSIVLRRRHTPFLLYTKSIICHPARRTLLKMADLDNLEYYIKFPSPNFNYNQQLAENDYVFVVNEKKIPIVLLFGWAGCQDKYLSKYSEIYEQKGLITIRYTAPVNCLFWRRFQMKAIGEKLVKLLVDMSFENHPIIVHVFSNGGAFLYQHFSAALENTPKTLQVKGVIFDSAPGKRRILSLYRAISAIIGGNICYNIPMSFLLTLFLSVVWLFEIVSNYLSPQKAVLQSNPMEYLKNEVNLWPQHFIYSKVDTLIPYKDIEAFASCRKQNGVDVTSLCFEDTPHVKHYSHNKTMYINSVCTFINKCLTAKSD